jgi:hypothetical protein
VRETHDGNLWQTRRFEQKRIKQRRLGQQLGRWQLTAHIQAPAPRSPGREVHPDDRSGRQCRLDDSLPGHACRRCTASSSVERQLLFALVASRGVSVIAAHPAQAAYPNSLTNMGHRQVHRRQDRLSITYGLRRIVIPSNSKRVKYMEGYSQAILKKWRAMTVSMVCVNVLSGRGEFRRSEQHPRLAEVHSVSLPGFASLTSSGAAH